MTAQDTLLAAAVLAGGQHTTSKAVSRALSFLDRFPAALRVLDEAERHGEGPSVALALCLHCGGPADVAESIACAARGAA
jgi:hypothetical protein